MQSAAMPQSYGVGTAICFNRRNKPTSGLWGCVGTRAAAGDEASWKVLLSLRASQLGHEMPKPATKSPRKDRFKGMRTVTPEGYRNIEREGWRCFIQVLSICKLLLAGVEKKVCAAQPL